ncbi:hypothetical protein BD289DRAFT_122469 [Coniella lustricola]|uniref:Uncharacterized protein n=1 Tax=Coniella lustricola TaxID=2025994 RepID=A0A2T2ZWI9_9PEZI|nr:hypothetical protein BD289DRAFT_122469 [Coniella lustricola]
MAAPPPAPGAQPPQSPAPSPRATTTTQERSVGTTNLLADSLRVGAGVGAVGLLFGATAGIVKGTTPILFSLSTGIQWFSLSSAFYGTRYAALARLGPVDQATPSQKLQASAIGGGVSGATVAGILRGPRNILPAALMFSLLGAGGQFAVNKRTGAGDAVPRDEASSWLNFRFSPMKKLTDAEYEHMLSEKLLVLEAEIAIVEDSIAELKAQKLQQEAGTSRL